LANFKWKSQMTDRELIQPLMEAVQSLQELRHKIQLKQKREDPKILFTFLGLSLVRKENQVQAGDKIVLKRSKYEKTTHKIDHEILQISIVLDKYVNGEMLDNDELTDILIAANQVIDSANKLIILKKRKSLEKTFKA
jgi:hypothetical protein